MHALTALEAAHHSLHVHLQLHHRFQGPRVDYVAVGLAALVSWLVVSGPGEALLIAAGISAAHHHVDIVGVLIVAAAGAALGGMMGWVIGRVVGRPLMSARGPLNRLRLRLLASGDRIYERYGAFAVILGPSWMAGVNRMPFGRFMLINVVWATVWASGIGLGAYFVGPSIADIVADLGTAGLVGIGVIGGLAVLRQVRHRRKGVTS